MLDILSQKPVRRYLKERETLIPRKKLIEILEGSSIGQIEELIGQELPIDRVRAEDAIEIVARSTWAQELAKGVCGPGYVGFTPGTPEYERCVYNVSHRVAARVLGLTWPPPAPPAPPVAPPPRRRR